MSVDNLATQLGEIVGSAFVQLPTAAHLADETETRGLRGSADLVVAPGSTEEVAARAPCTITSQDGKSSVTICIEWESST